MDIEKITHEAEDLLRRTIFRVTLDADGLDDDLERELSDLRNAVRHRASTAQLRSRVHRSVTRHR